MAKQLTCDDVVPGCRFTATGATESEVLEKAAAHARETHDVKEITPDLAAKVKSAIKDR
jgi:predicted small metal-binding protein